MWFYIIMDGLIYYYISGFVAQLVRTCGLITIKSLVNPS